MKAENMNILVSSTRQWNPGDEFILMGVRNLFRDLYKNHTFNWVLYDRNPDLFLDGYNKPIHRENLVGNSFHHYTSKCIDIAVIAGTPEWFGSPLLKFYHAVKKSSFPLFLLGVGYIDAPITFSEEEKYCFKNLLKTAIVRDKYASRSLTSIGIKHRLLPCPALFASKKERSVSKLEKIAFILQTDKTICQSISAELIHRSILEIRKLRNDGYKVDVICNYVDEFVDFAKNLSSVRYSFDSHDYLNILSDYDLIVSTRLHGAILANSLGKPAIMINTTDTRCKGASSLFPFIYSTDLNNLFDTINKIEINTLDRLIGWKQEIKHKYLDILQNDFSEIKEIVRKKSHKKKVLNLLDGIKQGKIKKTLIAIGLTEHMGDIVACEPVSRYLRKAYPNAHILWAVREPYRELIDNNPYIDETLVVNCLSEWITVSDSGIFNKIIDLHVNNRICPVCKIPLQKKNGNVDINVDNYYNYGSLLKAFCEGAGLPLIDDSPRVYMPDSVIQTVNDLNLPNEFITFNCFSNEVSRDWQNSKWVNLAEQIYDTFNIAIVEVGLKSALINNNQKFTHLNLCGKLSLLETAEVIRRSMLFVGVDSGPAHLANAVGTFGVVLLGHYRAFRHYMPYSGDYANGTKAELIYNENGPASDIPVLDILHAVSRHVAKSPQKSKIQQSKSDSDVLRQVDNTKINELMEFIRLDPNMDIRKKEKYIKALKQTLYLKKESFKESFPLESDNTISLNIEHIELHDRYFEISGWAFINGEDSMNSKILIILKSEKNCFVFETSPVKRPDVTSFFHTLNYDDSGFSALIPNIGLEDGEYKIIIYIKKGPIKAYHETDEKIVIKNDSFVKDTRGVEAIHPKCSHEDTKSHEPSISSDGQIDEYERMLKARPDDKSVLNMLAELYLKKGDKGKALQHYEKIVELVPDDAEALKNLADVYQNEFSRLEDALNIYVKVRGLHPEDSEVLQVIENLTKLLGESKGAINFDKHIKNIQNDNIHKAILRNRGYCNCCDKDVYFSSNSSWFRDNYVCENCGCIPRERALMYCIEHFYPNWKELNIHESSPLARGASLKLKSHAAKYIASNFIQDFPLGEIHETGFINQDLENQTFEAETFDLVVTQDVMEHLFNPAKAFTEIARTLKKGGAHVFTVPIINKDKPTEIWAERNLDGSINFIGKPEYHQNPCDKNGSVVTMHWGYDITDIILKNSGLNTTIIYIDNIDLGIRAEYIEVLISRKI